MSEDNKFELSRRKILGAAGAVGVTGALGGAGTAALFSDEENSTGNAITAGKLDLKIDWDMTYNGAETHTDSQPLTDNPGPIFEIPPHGDVKPGDSGEATISLHNFHNPAWVHMGGALTANDDNGLTEPEGDVDDTGGDGEGELAEKIEARVWYDGTDEEEDGGNNTFEDGETVIASGSLSEVMGKLSSGVLLEDQTDTGSKGCFPNSTTQYVGFEWELPKDVGNVVQSDSVEFDLKFHAQQCRHVDDPENPFADGECPECSFDVDATGDGASNLLSVGPDPSSGFPDIDARVRVDTPTGNAGDLTASNFAICEDGCGQTIESVAFEPGGLADIVVVFDDTGSMGDEISTMQSKVNSLTSDIESAGIDARYALVSFNDEAELDQDFTDASTFQTAVNNLSASGGADLPEDNLDALAVGTGNAAGQDGAGTSLSTFRSGAQRIVIDITDAPAQPKGDHSDDFTDPDNATTRYSQSEIETFLNDGNVTYYAVSPPESETGPISKQTIANNVDDGTWLDIDSADFGVILDDVVSAITDPAYVLSYTTTNPATDGSTRTVDVEIDDPDEGLLYEEGTYTAPS